MAGIVITGTKARQSGVVGKPLNPFAGVTLSDPTTGDVKTLTIDITGAGGTLADGAGFSGLVNDGGGVYTLTGSAAAVTRELDALAFTPAAVQPGAIGTTTLLLSDSNLAATTLSPTTEASLSSSGALRNTASITQANSNLLINVLSINQAGTSSDTVLALPVAGTGAFTPVTVATIAGTSIFDLTADSAGNLYGLASAGGSSLPPDSALVEVAYQNGKYAATAVTISPLPLYPFGSVGNLSADSHADLFFTAGNGSDDGDVYEVVKGANGYAAPVRLAQFNKYPNSAPYDMLLDSAGNLFVIEAQNSVSPQTAAEIIEIANTATGYAAPQLVVSVSYYDPHLSNLIEDSAGDLFFRPTTIFTRRMLAESSRSPKLPAAMPRRRACGISIPPAAGRCQAT